MDAGLAIANLHLKFANKTWNETFRLVRTCTDRSRGRSKPCEPLCRAVERLQEVLNVSSASVMRCRLETIARKQGMGFHVNEATCYLTADLFYLEVALLPHGGVEDVKMAPHARSPVRSERLLRLLRAKNFPEFSLKLADLFSQYNIPGESEIKVRVFESLRHLAQDLQDMSRLYPGSEAPADPINDGLIGCLTAAGEDRPLTLRFHAVPAPGRNLSDSFVQAAQVTVGASDTAHELQLASALLRPAQLDTQRRPVFLPRSELPLQALPACFLLRLQPPMPLLLSFIGKIGGITGLVVPDVDLEGAPLHKLLMSGGTKEDGNDAVSKVHPDAGATRGYVLPVAAWDAPAQRAAVVERVPFTHPAHVPTLLELLRRQSAINALLRSCVAPPASECAVSELYELLPESETSFSVTFQRPDSDSLAVLLVNITDPRRIDCELFGAGIQGPAVAGNLSAALKRSMSVPLTLRVLCSQLEKAPATAQVQAVNGAAVSQGAPVPEGAGSELFPGIKTSVNVDLLGPGGDSGPRWVINNSP